MEFWKLVLGRAFYETSKILGLTSLRRLPISILSYIGAVLILRFIPGGVEQMGEEIRWVIAVIAAAGIMFIPIFIFKLATIPSNIYKENKTLIDSLQTNDVNTLITKLKSQTLKTNDGSEETYEFLLAGELADDLVTDGVPTIETGEVYKGLGHDKLRRFLADMCIYGLVKPIQRVIERDRGYPYTEADYFLTDLGAKVISQIHKIWETEDMDS